MPLEEVHGRTLAQSRAQDLVRNVLRQQQWPARTGGEEMGCVCRVLPDWDASAQINACQRRAPSDVPKLQRRRAQLAHLIGQLTVNAAQHFH
jgi:hypothetical protein